MGKEGTHERVTRSEEEGGLLCITGGSAPDLTREEKPHHLIHSCRDGNIVPDVDVKNLLIKISHLLQQKPDRLSMRGQM
jgi:hypothetical protein